MGDKENKLKLQEMVMQKEQALQEWLKFSADTLIFAAANALEDPLHLACSQYRELQGDKKTGPLQNIYFSCLYTNLLEKRPLLRIDLCDTRGICSPIECCANWDVTMLMTSLFAWYDPLYIACKENRISDYNCRTQYLRVGMRLFLQMKPIILQALEQYFAKSSLTELYEKNKVRFWMGEYMDEYSLLLDFGGV